MVSPPPSKPSTAPLVSSMTTGMSTERSCCANEGVIETTWPICTPRYLTGAPSAEPLERSLEEDDVARDVLEQQAAAEHHGDPDGDRQCAQDKGADRGGVAAHAHVAGSRRGTAALAAAEECHEVRILALGEQLLGWAHGGHGVRGGVEVDHPIGDAEDARELMGDDDEAHRERPPQIEDQVVETVRGDRVEPGRRLVQEQDRRVQGHRSRDRRPLGHAAADRRRQEVLEAGEADQSQLVGRDRRSAARVEAGIELRAASPRSRPTSSRSTRPRPGTSCRTAGSAPRARSHRRPRNPARRCPRSPRAAAGGR